MEASKYTKEEYSILKGNVAFKPQRLISLPFEFPLPR